MIQVRMSRGVAVLTFEVRSTTTTPTISLVKGAYLEALLQEIDRQYNNNHRQIVINITPVSKIDGETAIGLMSKRSKAGIRICFYDLQRSVRNILKTAPGLSGTFDLYESAEVAIASFNQNP